MTTRKKIIVGNWKMNLNVHEASLYVHRLSEIIPVHRDVEVVLAPTMLALQPLSLQVRRRQFKLAAQNFYWRDFGAFTGEVSASQLRGLVEYGIVGHSERRHVFHERDKMIRDKVQAALRNHIAPILCIGETTHERSSGETTGVLHDQLTSGLANVTGDELSRIVIAYEPVWAIGTGKNALPDDVTKAVRVIRRHVEHLFGATKARDVRILYGGSVTKESASAYLALEGVDGLLVGGASLKLHDFAAIVASGHHKSDIEKGLAA